MGGEGSEEGRERDQEREKEGMKERKKEMQIKSTMRHHYTHYRIIKLKGKNWPQQELTRTFYSQSSHIHKPSVHQNDTTTWKTVW
jgi:hypothetical protein